MHGIPVDLNRRVGSDEIARVEDRVQGDGVTGAVSHGHAVANPDDHGELTTSPALPATTHTDYVYGPPDATWWATVGLDSNETGTGGELLSSDPVTYRAGDTYQRTGSTVECAQIPRHHTVPVAYCPAGRTDDGIALLLSTATDADPTHSGKGRRDGHRLAAATGAAGRNVHRLASDVLGDVPGAG
jgi:hypothetical protein